MAHDGTDRRGAVVRAALRCMAQHGYDRTSTARICAEAGVSSGTFFHYFPSKADVLAAVLQDDLTRTRSALDAVLRLAGTDAWAALECWRDDLLAEASDDDLAGIATALGAVPDHPGVAAALDAELTLTHQALTRVVTLGQHQGTIRNDAPAERLATWLGILADGVLSHAVTEGSGVTTDGFRSELTDALTRLLRPGHGTGAAAG